MSPATATPQARALQKASALRWSAQAEQVTKSDWIVKSQSHPASYYTVRHHGDSWVCNCVAGQRGLRCYHAAAAFAASLRDQAGTQPTPPAAPERVMAPSSRNGRGVGFGTRPIQDDDLDRLYDDLYRKGIK